MTDAHNRATFVDVLREHAQQRPAARALTFLAGDQGVGQQYTYGELDQRARAVAALLQQHDAYGRRALLLYPHGTAFIEAFLGALYAGCVPVPLYPPRRNQSLERIRAVADNAESSLILTTESIRKGIDAQENALVDWRPQTWVETENAEDSLARAWQPADLRPDSLAFLQYTSGSTGAPKGVMVSHGNLISNQRMIQSAFKHEGTPTVVGWLPLYHDMGLIGNLMHPLYLGASCVLMSPVDFLKRPARWLEAISTYRARTSGGPDFAYSLCVDKVSDEDQARLDLSCWKLAFNGAEPVRSATMNRFVDRFARSGFRGEAFYPTYGLAEATLFVTGDQVGQASDVLSVDPEALTEHRVEEAALSADAQRLVGCGVADEEVTIAIVGAEGRECEPGTVGEIWIKGPSVAQGYWNAPELTKEAFENTLPGREGAYLRTKDLGFVHEGSLYVTGRLQDLVIIRGRNYYPQDLERAAESSHSALRDGSGAAFTVELDGGAALVVVVEVRRSAWRSLDAAEATQAIRHAIALEHGLDTHAVVLVKPGAVKKTSSGKVRRKACRKAFERGEFEEVRLNIPVLEGRDAASSDDGRDADHADNALLAPEPGSEKAPDRLVAALVEGVARLLKRPASSVQIDIPLTSQGLDSLGAITFAAHLEEKLDVTVSVEDLLGGQTLNHLAESLATGAGRAASIPRATPLYTEPGVVAYEASPGQTALWMLHHTAPNAATYQIVRAVRLRAEVDESALRVALQQLVTRHAALRTSFAEDRGVVQQRVVDEASVRFDVVECASERHRETLLARAAAKPLTLSEAPLLRTVLYRGPNVAPVLLLVVHHIVADLWSVEGLLRELQELYGAAYHAQPSSLAAARGRVVDYGAYVDAHKDTPEGAAVRAYWKRQLDGAPQVLELPESPADDARRGSESAQVAGRLPLDLSRRVDRLAAEEGTTSFAVLMAAFQLLLHRYTEQEDLLTGTVSTGRSRAEWANTVGYFVNLLPLRSTNAGDPTVRSFVQQTRATLGEARAHQPYPFPSMVEDLAGRRRSDMTPLVQALFAMQQAHQSSDPSAATGMRANYAPLLLGLEGGCIPHSDLPLTSVAVPTPSAEFEIAMSVARGEEGYALALLYRTRLFDDAAAERFVTHYVELLKSMTMDPAQRLSQLSMLKGDEQVQVTTAWNETQEDYPSETLLHSPIEEQAARAPDSVAVVLDGVHLTYGVLERQANQLAHLLMGRGVGPGVTVGVCQRRSVEMVVSMVAILKAGGSYLPLDPDSPPARLVFSLQETQAAVALCAEAVRSKLGESAVPVVTVEAAWEVLDALPASRPSVKHRTNQLAYVMYTSGSTGRPKGVMIEHAGIANRLHWMQQAYGLTPEDRVVQKTPFGFDVSVWEFFWPLWQGAALVMARPGGHRDPEYLASLMQRERITTAHFVPSMLRAFLQASDVAAKTRTLARVICSGEALTHDLRDQFFDVNATAGLHNLYGPTEASIDVTVWACERTGGSQAVPIGRPVANMRTYVLDEHLRPVPIGVPGQLYLGGIGLARGYCRRSRHTAERFIPDPFANHGERLYKTGDRASWRPDGALAFHGRVDRQIKLRGFRIELNEIEATLRSHPDIAAAAVVVREQGTEQLLAAYVVPVGEAELSSRELRLFLGARLPRYMVPGSVTVLDTLPQTSSGKIDRKSLPAPDRVTGNASEAPRSELESVLCDAWKEVLGVSAVGIHDNFFDLGGHSLMAMKIASEVRRAHGTELPIALLFEAPTVAQLADQLHEMGQGTEATLDGRSDTVHLKF
ncbi:MAG: amino acid adenylation domain-containing protein [Bacteroidota bacterium]